MPRASQLMPDDSLNPDEWIPNINIGEDYDRRYADATIHYDALDNLASFFGRHMPVHRHAQFLQIHYIDRGAISFQIDDQLYQLEGPALFMTPPAIPHSFKTEDNAPGHVLTVHQSVVWQLMKRDMQIGQELDINRVICITPESLNKSLYQQWQTIEQIFGSLQQEWNADQAAKSLILENLTSLLIIQVARLSDRQTSGTSVSNDGLRIFRQFSDQVELHFKDHWLLPEYTQTIGVSESRLNQICRHICNSSPKQIIIERVLLEAKRQLTFSGKSVSAIGYEVGFNDPAYFTRFFKKQTGLSPLAYRKNPSTV